MIHLKFITEGKTYIFNKKALTFLLAVSISHPCFSGTNHIELTEFQVLQLGMENPQIQAQWNAKIEKARAQILNSGRWENPSIEYSQENLNLPNGKSEENTLWLKQKINIAGVNGLERKAALSHFEAQKNQQLLDARDWQRLLREQFYATLAAQEKLAVLNTVRSRLTTVSDFVSQRAKRGDASQFDALRINKELSIISSQYAKVEATYTNLRHELHSKIALATQSHGAYSLKPHSLTGQLLPKESSTWDLGGKRNWLNHPQVLAIEASLEAAKLNAKAAGRGSWPEVDIGIGYKEVNEPAFSADGNTVSIGLTLPLFDRGRGEKRIAQSATHELRARKSLLLDQLNATWLSAVHSLRTHQKVALRLKSLSSDSKRSLSRLAEASYQAGELSVMELIDAYQSDLAISEQYIDTAFQARLAHIQIQHFLGE